MGDGFFVNKGMQQVYGVNPVVGLGPDQVLRLESMSHLDLEYYINDNDVSTFGHQLGRSGAAVLTGVPRVSLAKTKKPRKRGSRTKSNGNTGIADNANYEPLGRRPPPSASFGGVMNLNGNSLVLGDPYAPPPPPPYPPGLTQRNIIYNSARQREPSEAYGGNSTRLTNLVNSQQDYDLFSNHLEKSLTNEYFSSNNDYWEDPVSVAHNERRSVHTVPAQESYSAGYIGSNKSDEIADAYGADECHDYKHGSNLDYDQDQEADVGEDEDSVYGQNQYFGVQQREVHQFGSFGKIGNMGLQHHRQQQPDAVQPEYGLEGPSDELWTTIGGYQVLRRPSALRKTFISPSPSRPTPPSFRYFKGTIASNPGDRGQESYDCTLTSEADMVPYVRPDGQDSQKWTRRYYGCVEEELDDFGNNNYGLNANPREGYHTSSLHVNENPKASPNTICIPQCGLYAPLGKEKKTGDIKLRLAQMACSSQSQSIQPSYQQILPSTLSRNAPLQGVNFDAHY